MTVRLEMSEGLVAKEEMSALRIVGAAILRLGRVVVVGCGVMVRCCGVVVLWCYGVVLLWCIFRGW